MSMLALKVPTPKFAQGDKVFYADAHMTSHTVECPDCGGTGKWPITSPAGHAFTIGCARCRYNYGFREPEMSLSWPTFTGTVKELTIGSVRINTSEDDPISYMCLETGVGSGSVYYERDFYADKDTAKKAADGKAQVSNLSHKGVRTAALTALPNVHLTYENALEAAYEKRWREMRYRIGYLISDLEDAADINEIPAIIRKFKTFETDEGN